LIMLMLLLLLVLTSRAIDVNRRYLHDRCKRQCASEN